MKGLTFRKVGDRSKGERLVRYDHEAGEKYLLNPANGKREGWPLLAFTIEEILDECTIPTSTVDRYSAENLVKLVDEKVVTFPGGPPHNPHQKIHVFRQASHLIFYTFEGEVKYKVTHNPGKYPDGNATRVDHFYNLELVSAPGNS